MKSVKINVMLLLHSSPVLMLTEPLWAHCRAPLVLLLVVTLHVSVGLKRSETVPAPHPRPTLAAGAAASWYRAAPSVRFTAVYDSRRGVRLTLPGRVMWLKYPEFSCVCVRHEELNVWEEMDKKHQNKTHVLL